LERIIESNGGIREEEPSSLSRVYDKKVLSILLWMPVSDIAISPNMPKSQGFVD